jgi:hypothetical protein
VWTVRLPDDAVSVDTTGRVVRVAVTDLAVVDERLDGTVPAVVSFDIEWKGRGRRRPLTTATPPFAGDFFQKAAARGTFAGSEDGFAFDSRTRVRSIFAMLGTEQNGLFAAAAQCPRCVAPEVREPERR